MYNNNPLNKHLKTIAKGSGIGFAGVIFGTAAGYISRLIIAQFLGPDEYGLISLGYSVMMIGATFSLMGLNSGIQRYIAYYIGKRDTSKVKGTIFSALKVTLPMSLLATIILFIGAGWISSNIFHEDKLKIVLLIFSIGIPFWTMASLFNSVYIGFQQVKYQVYTMYLFKDLAKLIMIILFLVFGYGLLGASIGWIIAIIAMTMLSSYFLIKKVLTYDIKKTKTVFVDKELYLFSFPLIFAGLASLITGWTDTFMLGYFSSSTEVGIYNAALPTSQLLRMVLSPIGQILFPVITALYAEKNYHYLESIYSIVTKWIFSIVFPGFLFIVIFSQDLLSILFGEAFTTGSNALSILAFGVLISATMGPAQQIITVYGKTKIILWCSSFTAFTNILLNFFLIPLYGINGAAIATSTSIGLVSILHLIFANRIGKIQPFRYSFIKPLFSALITAFVVFEIIQKINMNSYLLVVFGLISFVTLYISIIYFMKGFEKEEVILISDLNREMNPKIKKIVDKICKLTCSDK